MITLSIFTPRSTRLTFSRLLTKKPAAASSAIESAICAVASDERKRAAPRAPDGWPAWPFSADDEIGPRAVQRGEQAEEQARAERQRRAANSMTRRADRERHRCALAPAAAP